MINIAIAFFIIPLFIWVFLNGRRHGKPNQKLPPGPRPLPIIGNLHLIGQLPHQTFTKMSHKYGPIMLLRLGNVPTIVVSSPKEAKLFYKQHDAVFASRPRTQASIYLSYGLKGLGFTPYGDYWRRVRKMCTLQLFTYSKVMGFEKLRSSEIVAAIQQLKLAATKCEVVDVGEKVAELVEEITFKMVVGKGKDEKNFKLKEVVDEALLLAGAFNLADFIPILAPFNLQGLTKRLKVVSKMIDEILESIIEDHLIDENLRQSKDIVATLLTSMNNPNENSDFPSLGRDNIKAIILDLFFGGLDTSVVVVTWAIASLLKYPRIMNVLQEELDTIVGKGRMIRESDLSKLSYLDMVVKETLRLHPVGPFLIPHESLEEVVVNGYLIPKKSRILVNTWAIGRDPTIWSNNANEFYPERFMNKDIDIRGQDFELIPFGSGRRGCPGFHLGLITVKIILAHFVHCFNWELPNGMQPQEVDMEEKFGLVLQRANKLLAMPTCRLLQATN